MPQPRVPTNILKLRGADKKNPGRMKKRGNEPNPKGPLGSPPRHLDDLQKNCWRELVKIVPEGVFANCDRWAVEIACVLMAEFRAAPQMMSGARLSRLDSLLGRFGIVPADRSRVSVPKQKEKNPFDVEPPKAGKRKLIPGTRILI